MSARYLKMAQICLGTNTQARPDVEHPKALRQPLLLGRIVDPHQMSAQALRVRFRLRPTQVPIAQHIAVPFIGLTCCRRR